MDHGLNEGCELLPCSNCQRHVGCAPTCPFCGARIEVCFKPYEFRLKTRLTRAQQIFVGAALTSAGIALASCGERSVPVYGAPGVGGGATQGGFGGTAKGGASAVGGATGGTDEGGNGTGGASGGGSDGGQGGA
jgi:hypothetical protein